MTFKKCLKSIRSHKCYEKEDSFLVASGFHFVSAPSSIATPPGGGTVHMLHLGVNILQAYSPNLEGPNS